MKKQVLFVIFSCATLFGFAQESLDSLPTRTPFWKSFSIEASTGISSFSIDADKKTTEPELASLLENAASNQNCTDFRIGLNYHLSPQFSFQTGLEYSISWENYSFIGKETVGFCRKDSIQYVSDSSSVQTSYVYVWSIGDSVVFTQRNERNNYLLLSIPFQFSYTSTLALKNELEFSLGGSISIYGRNIGYAIVDTQNEVITSEEAYHTSGMLSLGASVKYLYRLGNQHAIYIEPWARFGVTNQSSPALSYETFRKAYGVRVGYRYFF